MKKFDLVNAVEKLLNGNKTAAVTQAKTTTVNDIVSYLRLLDYDNADILFILLELKGDCK
jgi:hypothetical protein